MPTKPVCPKCKGNGIVISWAGMMQSSKDCPSCGGSGLKNGGVKMKKWVIRFRVVSPTDYHTPLMYLPIETTYVEAETAEKAWEKWVTAPSAAPREWYRKIDIYETGMQEI